MLGRPPPASTPDCKRVGQVRKGGCGPNPKQKKPGSSMAEDSKDRLGTGPCPGGHPLLLPCKHVCRAHPHTPLEVPTSQKLTFVL